MKGLKTIKKGSFFLLTCREYSDYAMAETICKATEDIDIIQMEQEFTGEREWLLFSPDKFVDWLIYKKVCVKLDFIEWHFENIIE